MKDQIIGEDVKFVKNNFPVINRQSPQLAQASQSAWSQTNKSTRDHFWQWHRTVYQNQGGYGTNWATVDRIVEITRQVEGIDAEQIRKDIESGKFRSETGADLREGRSLGIRGTPTFIIFNEENGKSRRLVGPQPISIKTLYADQTLHGYTGFGVTAILAFLMGNITVATVSSLKRNYDNTGSFITTLGSIIGFASAGCASCGVGVLALLGVTGGSAVLPFNGLEVQAFSIMILLGSMEYIGRQDKVCKI